MMVVVVVQGMYVCLWSREVKVMSEKKVKLNEISRKYMIDKIDDWN